MKVNPALYIHVPFCAHICHYCDFCHVLHNEKKASEWLELLQEEMAERLHFIPQTIYIGGGTPTALSVMNLRKLLKMLKPYMIGQECTIEINPETFSKEKALLLQEFGINRASIGVQSTDKEELTILGRNHSFQQVADTCCLLREVGIDNYSMDILYSFPTQTKKSFQKTIEDILSLEPKHLSLYSLTIEQNTVFGRRNYQPFEEDKEADFYEYAVNVFEKNGYEQYEIANFAKKGYRSLHNQVYWRYDDFLGLSMGASSKMNHERSDNTRSFAAYRRKEWVANRLALTTQEEKFEFLMMNLRLKEGFLIEEFNNRFQSDFLREYADALKLAIQRNWITIEEGFLRVIRREILHSVLLLFMED